jgi:hypothetical protein
MKPQRKIFDVCVAAVTLTALFWAAPVRAATPSQADIDQMTADFTGTDAAGIDSATQSLRDGIKSGWVSANLWMTWLPALVKDKRYDDVMDLSMLGIANRPDTAAITPLLEIRVQALLAQNKADDALSAAKSYYNACAYRQTTGAVDLLAQCLTKARPTDADIARRFRSEQAAASVPLAGAAPTDAPTPDAGPILKGITIDEKPWDAAIQTWSSKTTKAADRGGYANLLLAADRGKEAEAVFREIYMSATTNEDYVTGAEGIAKSLRAEDWTVARSNAWLASIEPVARPATPARQPAGTPKAGGRPPAAPANTNQP